jgi:MFS family permease
VTAPGEDEATEKAKMRRVLAIFGPAVFAGAFATRVTDPTVAEIAGEFSVTAAEAALLGTAYTLPFALVQPILGPVADSIGKRRIVMICVALLGVMLLAAAVSASFGWLMAFRAASGMAAGGMMPLTLAIMGDAVSLKYRQVALSRILVFGISGQIAGGVVAGTEGLK